MTETNRPELDRRRVELIGTYFRYVDAGDPRVPSLFTEDVRMWFPKFGTGHGREALGRFAARLGLAGITHDIDRFRYLVSGDTIVVEGTERGVTLDGQHWPDGEVSQGRFCSVFDFDGPLISGMSIYVDPDFTSSHTERINALRGDGH